MNVIAGIWRGDLRDWNVESTDCSLFSKDESMGK